MAIWDAFSSKISEFIKDPRKAMTIIFTGSVFCLFAPEAWLKSISVLGFTAQYRDPYIGIALGLTSLWFVYDFLAWVHTKIKNRITAYRKKRSDQIKRKELIGYFDNLSEKERNIILRYPRFGRNVIGLTLNGEDVFNFIEKELICQVDGMMEGEGENTYYYFRLNELVKSHVFSIFSEEVALENKQ